MKKVIISLTLWTVVFAISQPVFGQQDTIYPLTEELIKGDFLNEINQGEIATLPRQGMAFAERVIYWGVISLLLLSLVGAFFLLKKKTTIIENLEEKIQALESKYATTLASLNILRTKEEVLTNSDVIYATFPSNGDLLHRKKDILKNKGHQARIVIENYQPQTGEAVFSIIDELAIQEIIIRNELLQLLHFCDADTMNTIGKSAIITISKGRIRKLGKVWKVIEKSTIQLI